MSGLGVPRAMLKLTNNIQEYKINSSSLVAFLNKNLQKSPNCCLLLPESMHVPLRKKVDSCSHGQLIIIFLALSLWRFSINLNPKFFDLKLKGPANAKCLLSASEEVPILLSTNSSGQLLSVNGLPRESSFPRPGVRSALRCYLGPCPQQQFHKEQSKNFKLGTWESLLRQMLLPTYSVEYCSQVFLELQGITDKSWAEHKCCFSIYKEWKHKWKFLPLGEERKGKGWLSPAVLVH